MELCKEKGIHISTMTVTAKVVGSYICPPSEYKTTFAEFLPPNDRTSKKFNNQYTLKIPIDTHSVNVKVFRNGTLQVSGCKSISDMHKLAQILQTRAHMDIGEFKIAMINSNFSVPHRVDLYQMALHCRTLGLHTNYDQQRHPALLLRYQYNPKNIFSNGICSCVVGYNPTTHKKDARFTSCACHRVSLLIFSTGRIVVTGANSIVQIVECYTYLMHIINDFKIESRELPRSIARPRRRRGRTNRQILAETL